jgi:hypothetical protein
MYRGDLTCLSWTLGFDRAMNILNCNDMDSSNDHLPRVRLEYATRLYNTAAPLLHANDMICADALLYALAHLYVLRCRIEEATFKEYNWEASRWQRILYVVWIVHSCGYFALF